MYSSCVVWAVLCVAEAKKRCFLRGVTTQPEPEAPRFFVLQPLRLWRRPGAQTSRAGSPNLKLHRCHLSRPKHYIRGASSLPEWRGERGRVPNRPEKLEIAVSGDLRSIQPRKKGLGLGYSDWNMGPDACSLSRMTLRIEHLLLYTRKDNAFGACFERDMQNLSLIHI